MKVSLPRRDLGEVIELSVESLPEGTEKERKRKRLLLLFIRFWKDLRGEVERVKSELEKGRENGQKILLSEIYVGTGPDCDSPHFHAINNNIAKTLEGASIADPGGCGYGRVKDTPVLEI